MLGNLCDNACKWAKRSVTLTVTHKVQTGKATPAAGCSISVDDDGPGPFRDAAGPHRSARRAARREQAGIRARPSIVLDLVQSYRGHLELAASEQGGLSARLDLPAA